MTEWIELKDLQAVAKAQSDGWEIEVGADQYEWFLWNGVGWSSDCKYRGRPKAARKVVRVREAVTAFGVYLQTEQQSDDVSFLGWVKGSEWREVEYE